MNIDALIEEISGMELADNKRLMRAEDYCSWAEMPPVGAKS